VTAVAPAVCTADWTLWCCCSCVHFMINYTLRLNEHSRRAWISGAASRWPAVLTPTTVSICPDFDGVGIVLLSDFFLPEQPLPMSAGCDNTLCRGWLPATGCQVVSAADSGLTCGRAKLPRLKIVQPSMD